MFKQINDILIITTVLTRLARRAYDGGMELFQQQQIDGRAVNARALCRRESAHL
jgi:hypothetical protein